MNITKSSIISIVGRPNVGKSTLTNALVGSKVAIVSNKPQTTRTRITGILNKDDTQYVFMDTPGLHSPKSRLGDFMVKIVNETVSDVDTVALVVEPIANIGDPEQELIDKIKQFELPAILVINKMDTIAPEKLLEVMAVYGAAHDFNAIVPVCAINKIGLEPLLKEFKKNAFEGPALFPDDMVSDQPEKVLVAEIIREKMLHSLEKEIPHGVAVYIERMSERPNGIVDIEATIFCEKQSHKGIVIGKQGASLKKIGSTARFELEKMFEGKVNLQLWVKVKEGWRNNLFQMRNFGYDE
ncbi:MAG: GTPase Era [Clostridia bacterium]